MAAKLKVFEANSSLPADTLKRNVEQWLAANAGVYIVNVSFSTADHNGLLYYHYTILYRE